jgi:type VI secretion system protein ImpA
MVANGWIGGEQWRLGLRGTPLAALRELHATLGACEVALEDLRKLASERFDPADTPNMVPLGNLLNEIREHLEPFVTPGRAALRESGRLQSPSAPMPDAQANTSEPIASRQQALRMLGEVAEWYRRTEPHSPVAALVARAARWGAMPFEQVLREVVRDEDVLMRAFEMLGIRPEGSEPG